MPLDPLLTPVLAAAPPVPESIDDWGQVRAEALKLHEILAESCTEAAPPGSSRSTHHVPVTGGEIMVHVYTPASPGPNPVHLYIHGGAWVAGSIQSAITERVLAERCVSARCAVVAVEYRKAPEHRFPTGLDDCYAALRWIERNSDDLSLDMSRLSIGGGSAGANLAAAQCLKVRDEGGPAIGFQLLEVPALDLTLSTSPSLVANAEGYGLETRHIQHVVSLYLERPEDAEHPYVSPLLAHDLRGLPPAHIMSAEFDPVFDDGRRYSARLEEAGVSATFSPYLGQIHMSPELTALLPAARTWRSEVADVLSRFHHG